MGYFVRPMRPQDIAQVARVEHECFPTGWTPTPFHRELENKRARYLVACEAHDPWQAEGESRRSGDLQEARQAMSLAGRLLSGLKRMWGPEQMPAQDFSYHIAGYVGLWFMADEAHITAIGTREDDRRKGVGELLLMATIEEGSRQGSRVVTLETRVSNYPAQALYYKYGFSRAGIRKAYYNDNREDALVMTTENLSNMAYRDLFKGLKAEHSKRWGGSVRYLG